MITLIVLGLIFIIGIIIQCTDCCDGEPVGAFTSIFVAIAIILCLHSVAKIPINLNQELQEAVSICNGVDMVKDAYYPSTDSPSALVNGSIENIKQSTNLTEAVSQCVKRKAIFNSNLAGYKAQRKNTLSRLFYQGMFIPNEIVKMEYLK